MCVCVKNVFFNHILYFGIGRSCSVKLPKRGSGGWCKSTRSGNL